MKVADMQQFFGHIASFAKAANASDKVAAELDRALQCLEPFKEKTLAEFNDFLRRADEFDRTGKLVPPTRTGGGKARAAKGPSLSVDEAVKIYLDLHAQATEPSLTFAEIEARMMLLEKLTMVQLKQVAARVNVTAPAKTKKQLLEGLTRRIKELKASNERTQYRFGA